MSDASHWFIDSGASCHMTHDRNLLNDFEASFGNGDITVANNEKLKVLGSGTASIIMNNETIAVKDVLHVPQLSANLLSVSRMVKSGNSVTFDRNGCSVKNSVDKLLTQVQPCNGTYQINGKTSCNMASTVDAMTWHRRLGV